jgi:hypothetical protein
MQLVYRYSAAIDEQLMAELQATKEATGADETLLVVDAMTGQEAAALTAGGGCTQVESSCDPQLESAAR